MNLSTVGRARIHLGKIPGAKIFYFISRIFIIFYIIISIYSLFNLYLFNVVGWNVVMVVVIWIHDRTQQTTRIYSCLCVFCILYLVVDCIVGILVEVWSGRQNGGCVIRIFRGYHKIRSQVKKCPGHMHTTPTTTTDIYSTARVNVGWKFTHIHTHLNRNSLNH